MAGYIHMLPPPPQTLLLYFTARFQHEWIVRTMDKARKTHMDGYSPYAVALRLVELDEEINNLRGELSPTYSAIILKFSTYEKPQQDKCVVGGGGGGVLAGCTKYQANIEGFSIC